MTHKAFIQTMADILNKDSDPKERERLVREASRKLYRAAVDTAASTTQADLALAAAALRERERRIK